MGDNLRASRHLYHGPTTRCMLRMDEVSHDKSDATGILPPDPDGNLLTPCKYDGQLLAHYILVSSGEPVSRQNSPDPGV